MTESAITKSEDEPFFFQFESGLQCHLSINSLASSEVLALVSKYNADAEKMGRDPVLNEGAFFGDDVYILELFENSEVIGLAAIRASITENEDLTAIFEGETPPDMTAQQTFIMFEILAVFAFYRYRAKVNGGVFGYLCGLALIDDVIDKTLNIGHSKLNLLVIVTAQCISKGGENFCEGFAEAYESGDFENSLREKVCNRLASYDCSVELDTCDLEITDTMERW